MAVWQRLKGARRRAQRKTKGPEIWSRLRPVYGGDIDQPCKGDILATLPLRAPAIGGPLHPIKGGRPGCWVGGNQNFADKFEIPTAGGDRREARFRAQ